MQFPMRTIAQVGAGLAAGAVGFGAGSTYIDTIRHNDLTSPPTKVIAADGTWIQEQSNTPHTNLATLGATALGFSLSALGMIVALGHGAGAAEPGITRAILGVSLLGAGSGLIGGSIATASSTSDTVIRPNRTPSNEGISIGN